MIPIYGVPVTQRPDTGSVLEYLLLCPLQIHREVTRYNCEVRLWGQATSYYKNEKANIKQIVVQDN